MLWFNIGGFRREMGKTAKWLRSFFTGNGKKETDKQEEERGVHRRSASPARTQSFTKSASTPPRPKEKKRWSFRKTVLAGKDFSSPDQSVDTPVLQGLSETNVDQKTQAETYVEQKRQAKTNVQQKRQGMAVVAATAAATDTTVAAVQAAEAVIRLTSNVWGRTTSAPQEVAAIKIQSVFRSYLARTALHALQGLVKLQALVRGQLVRKQAMTTLRCMQALLTVQAQATAQRLCMIDEAEAITRRQPIHWRSPQHPRYQHSYEMECDAEENAKIVEMDLGETRGASKIRKSIKKAERMDQRLGAYSGGTSPSPKTQFHQQTSPLPSALTDMTPRSWSEHFDEYPFTTVEASHHYLSDSTEASYSVSRRESSYLMTPEYQFYPNYMANTESSRAKARSQSAPKQRSDSYERQPSKRRPSFEGRSLPRAARAIEDELKGADSPFMFHNC